MINYIIYSLLSFLILISVAKISYKLNLVDLPSKRKKHSEPTAYTGGVALGIIFICSILMFDVIDIKLNLILSIGFLIAIVGFIDDKYNLRIGGKLSLQIIPIIYLVIIEKFNLNYLGYYNYFELSLNSVSLPFTLLAILFLINSFNYFDGSDGTLSFTTISVLSILYFLIPDENFRLFLATILIPIFFFLIFNFSLFGLKKLFLGDGGSLLLGFIIAFTLINLANQNIVHPILLAWSIVIFVYEFLSINFIRLKVNENIFRAGLDHLHHMLLKKTKSVLLTSLYISLINIILFIIGYLSFSFINPLTSLILFILLFIIFLILRYRLFKKN
jgi:UDP-GlcNAc:undecaprenyl-phosphate GlcNAc-1-phosphate transferase